jgi:hypothetical protein
VSGGEQIAEEAAVSCLASAHDLDEASRAAAVHAGFRLVAVFTAGGILLSLATVGLVVAQT